MSIDSIWHMTTLGSNVIEMTMIKKFNSTLIIWLLMAGMSQGQIAIKGEQVHTVSGGVITNGVVLIKDGKIESVGTEEEVEIPSTYSVYVGKVVTPGLVDAHATVGMTGIYNQSQDNDHLDKSNPIQPELRAFDAYNPQEELVTYLRKNGITTVHTGHSPGALISGQTMIAKTVGNTIEAVTVDKATMLVFRLGQGVGKNFKSPGTRSKGIAMLRTQLIKAQEYRKKLSAKKEVSRDLKMEALVALLEGKLKALITAHKAADIMTAIRLADEFQFKLVLDGVAEAYLVLDEIKKSGAGVIVHPSMMRTGGEGKNASFETAALLMNAGIPIAIQSGFEGYVPKVRVARFEAGETLRYGMSFDNALKVVTINAARIIGMESRLGSLEVGKDADIVVYDGDPFEYTTHVCIVIINGQVTDDSCKQ